MIVCYFGTYRQNYSRNKNMIAALRLAGVEVKECHVSLWHGVEDRVAVTSGGWKKPAFWGRVIKAYWQLLRKHKRIGDYDILMVGYPGQFDVFLARILANRRHKPLVWDVFMSIYLVALERGLDQAKGSSVKLIRNAEAKALKKPDMLIQDTQPYVDWLCQTYGLTPQKFRLVPTGADDRIFQPQPETSQKDNLIRVLYYGTYIPNHGVDVILGAAELLQAHTDILFEMIGEGPERAEAERFAQQKGLNNIHFQGWVSQTELPSRIAQADICLGAFGQTPQSLMTVHNKVYEGMAMGKPVITGQSPAIAAQFHSGEELLACPRTSQGLAESILQLKEDPGLGAKLGANALCTFQERYSLQSLGELLLGYLHEFDR